MTILFLDQFGDPGGAQRCLLDLLPAVAARGWKTHVAAPGDGALAGEAAGRGAVFHPIRCGPYHSGRKSLIDVVRFARQTGALAGAIAELARECRADLLYVNGPRLLPALRPGPPVIFHCHSYLGRRYAAALAGGALRRTGATVIAACRFVLGPLAGYLAPGRAHVVHNGVPEAPAARCPSAVPVIGVIGRVCAEKGQAEFLRAARDVPGCRFLVCGAPLFGDRAARRYAGRLGELAEGLPVKFTGWLEDASAALASLDLLVVPSTVPEASPRVILEAFAAGVPVLASNTGGIPELISHNETGFLIDSLDPAALARQMRDLLSDRDRLAAIAANAREAWQSHHTLSEYQRRILSIVETAGASARA